MKRLSKHFHESEFACPCCGKTDVSIFLVQDILEPIREHFGPIFISRGGGVRCRPYNERIRQCVDHGNYHDWVCPDCGILGKQRSARNSWHMKGTQADISAALATPREVQDWVRANLPAVTRLGCYPTFTHVGHGGASFKEWEG